MIKDHSCLSDRERESKESFRFLLVREFERITHQLSTRKALLITMEGLRQRSEVLKQKCERVQEVLLEMKTRTKIYYENQCKSTTDPTLLVPHWYQSSSAEYATMLRIHKKETFDYACINEALQKIEEAERQMNILEIESETLKWFQDQLSPLQPMLQDKCPITLLSTQILNNLDYAEEVNNEVEKSYNKGVWNRNEQAKQQKMEAVVMKKEDSIDGYDKRDKKIWSPKTWMKKIFLKKRSQSRDSFFESQEEEDDYHHHHHSSARRGERRQQSLSDRSLPATRETNLQTNTQEMQHHRRQAHRQQSLPDLFHHSVRLKKFPPFQPPK